MKKEKFIRIAREFSPIKKKKFEGIFDEVFTFITDKLRKGDNPVIANFGSFHLVLIRPEVIVRKNAMRVIVPPSLNVEFVSADRQEEDYASLPGNEEFLRNISVKYGLSIETARAACESIFTMIKKIAREDPGLQIRGFGEFKIYPQKNDVGEQPGLSFTASKKLLRKLNKIFDRLQKTELPVPDEPFIPETGEPDEMTAKNNSEELPLTKEDPAPVRRKLVSETLLKLHNEITGKEDKAKNKDSLWG